MIKAANDGDLASGSKSRRHAVSWILGDHALSDSRKLNEDAITYNDVARGIVGEFYSVRARRLSVEPAVGAGRRKGVVLTVGSRAVPQRVRLRVI